MGIQSDIWYYQKERETNRMEIITNAENRKELVKALSGHFEQRSEYLDRHPLHTASEASRWTGTQRSYLKMTAWKTR